MSPEQFVFWLQGFVEMNPNAMLTHTQWTVLKDHLALVMSKQTPNRYTPPAPLYNPGQVFPQDLFKQRPGDVVITC